MSLRTLLASAALALVTATATGCSQPVTEPTLVTALPSDGYLSFRAHHPHADGQPGVLVELREAEPGAYVLLYSPIPPRDVGWFELDPDAFEGCTARERKTGVSVLACALPHGRGEVVDIAIVEGPPLVAARDATATVSRPLGTRAILRHADCVTDACFARAAGLPTMAAGASWQRSNETSATDPKLAWTGYYALLRVAPDGRAVDVVIDGLSLEDEGDANDMSIERL